MVNRTPAGEKLIWKPGTQEMEAKAFPEFQIESLSTVPSDGPKQNRRKLPSACVHCLSVRPYCNFARVSLIAVKFGRSFGVGVCSLYCTTPFLSMTNAARAEVEPKPIRSGSSTP